MYRFLTFYIIAYGGAHLYFYIKLKRAYPLSLKKQFLFIALLAFLFISPLLSRKLESFGYENLADILSGSGYLWMGLLFLFVSAAVVIDIVNLTLAKTSLKIKPKTLFIASAAYTLVIGIYGYHEALNIVTEQLTIKSNRLPANIGRIRIVQISDLHIGQIVRESRVKAVLQAVKAASPDILVSTGDLVDGHQKHFIGLEQLFLNVNPRLGKYAILGNHEYYAGVDDSVKFMQGAGFKLLKNENFNTGAGLCITGVDDSHNKAARLVNAVIERNLLEALPQDTFRLLLKHRPILENSSAGKFELQLSGHVHKGQIFPFNFITWLSFPVRVGLTELKNGSHLYVSRGTGEWGPPIRFLAPPEITVIDLVPIR